MITDIEKTKQGSRRLLRIELFSDAVFAIAITILVLQPLEMLHRPGQEGVLQFYLHHWQSLLAYLVGFCTILICWINHHHIFSYINKVDGKLMWLNGLMLLVVTFTPFPTAVLATYLEEEGPLLLTIFGFNYLLMGIATYSISACAYNHFYVEPGSRPLFHCIKLTYKYAVIYLLCVSFVCFISIPVSIALYAMLFFIFAFPKTVALKVLKTKRYRQRQVKNQELESRHTKTYAAVH